MKEQNLVILGSTGSIGEQALEIVDEHSDRFNVLALSCNTNWRKLAEQVNEFHPKYALVCDADHLDDFKAALTTDVEIIAGAEALGDLAALEQADVILNSLVGFSGFEPTCRALKAGKKVALANKESLVVGGAIINRLLKENTGKLVPVDSEHSAMLQCLVGESNDTISKLIITASGGPFREWTMAQMKDITVSDALNHPNWSMGSKITIDSATMMNKGLEIIEAHWLFDLPLSKIEAVVHPQSIVHSVIEFVDGSSKAQLGPPTMKVPILYALTYPDRISLEAPTLDWTAAFDLNFEPVDYDKFPCIKLAINAIEEGGFKPAVLNAANEIAVDRFLNEEIPYIGISRIIETCLERLHSKAELTIQSLKEIDREARELALTI
ncbi:1-deoxy-D-xylulose-5-phosphate reductoisomerase [Balneolaceae bacterium YR4-1]|uniref:1-deoxy-D-xylulose 5-phosphate reductoisomerase n=1 Tax=Halalkalibaculum roseum TaxID=2709311 RepID=A0A6M1SYG0_9BACT|nr:1-deoxy-D-xylulose-5-phosphate reductoisomerase [Halalkalibaculum roseum]NGP76224.1 1-deoxy-D-xylulose-5-phosphate reductoisomerase [Halalkalibaculum roseum]